MQDLPYSCCSIVFSVVHHPTPIFQGVFPIHEYCVRRVPVTQSVVFTPTFSFIYLRTCSRASIQKTLPLYNFSRSTAFATALPQCLKSQLEVKGLFPRKMSRVHHQRKQGMSIFWRRLWKHQTFILLCQG